MSELVDVVNAATIYAAMMVLARNVEQLNHRIVNVSVPATRSVVRVCDRVGERNKTTFADRLWYSHLETEHGALRLWLLRTARPAHESHQPVAKPSTRHLTQAPRLGLRCRRRATCETRVSQRSVLGYLETLYLGFRFADRVVTDNPTYVADESP